MVVVGVDHYREWLLTASQGASLQCVQAPVRLSVHPSASPSLHPSTHKYDVSFMAAAAKYGP